MLKGASEASVCRALRGHERMFTEDPNVNSRAFGALESPYAEGVDGYRLCGPRRYQDGPFTLGGSGGGGKQLLAALIGAAVGGLVFALVAARAESGLAHLGPSPVPREAKSGRRSRCTSPSYALSLVRAGRD
jgi:hypothetical protein